MLKQTRTIFSLLIITGLLSGIVTISMLGCNNNQAAETSEPEENPKLSSYLNRLVQAEERGEAEEFAQQKGIELLYDNTGPVSVRVTIHCSPGQVGTATKVTENYGTIEAKYLDMIQAVIPITSLVTLANEESIAFIRLPVYAVDE
jgi:hypothetical protein